jgi:hypothetical protein
MSSFASLSSSKSSKMPARLMARALVFPWATNFSQMSRAGAVNRTALRFLGILHLLLISIAFRRARARVGSGNDSSVDMTASSSRMRIIRT